MKATPPSATQRQLLATPGLAEDPTEIREGDSDEENTDTDWESSTSRAKDSSDEETANLVDKNAALLQLMNQQQQALRQQQQEHAALMTGLVNQVNQMNVAPPVRDVLPKGITHSGSKEECYETWVIMITQTAVTQGWNGDNMR